MRYVPSHDPIESVAVLPQTVVIPAEIPSLETCLGVVGLNAKHLVAETRARIPETWACVDHAAASARVRLAARALSKTRRRPAGRGLPNTRRQQGNAAACDERQKWRSSSRSSGLLRSLLERKCGRFAAVPPNAAGGSTWPRASLEILVAVRNWLTVFQ